MNFKEIDVNIDQLKETHTRLQSLIAEKFSTKDELTDVSPTVSSLNTALSSSGMCVYTVERIKGCGKGKDSKEIVKYCGYLETFANQVTSAIKAITDGKAAFKSNSWYAADVVPMLTVLEAAAKEFAKYSEQVLDPGASPEKLRSLLDNRPQFN
jgi:hypothetical protein